MRAFVVLLCSSLQVLSGSASYPYNWSIGDVNLTCNLGDPGWKQAGMSCIFPFLARNQSWHDANRMCRSHIFGHSHGITLQNWLIARSLLTVVPPGIYWTGLNVSADQSKLEIAWDFTSTSIYNPLWATDEPHLSTNLRTECVALDLRTQATAGWRLLNCTERLPILCETFACMGDQFRCLDNTRCIPSNAVNDTFIDCADASDETKQIAKLSSVGHKRDHSLSSQKDCHDDVLTFSKGTNTSKGLSLSYYRKDSEVIFCPLPVIHNGYALEVTSSSKENLYHNGTALYYGCDFGRLPGNISTSICINGEWTPMPSCRDQTCPVVEKTYFGATLNGNPSLQPLSHAKYLAPVWSLPTNPFRVCAMDEHGTSYRWWDFNFAFKVPICRSYPVQYGHFEKEFYEDGEDAVVICSAGFTVITVPRCSKATWSSYNSTCIGGGIIRT